MRLELLVASLAALISGSAAAVEMSRQGCGETKGCLFRPAGCNPALDCTLGMIFHVTGPNQLFVQLTATTIVPPPPLQYIAIGFSHDPLMGDDYVAECVLSPQATQFGEPEVFASYNTGKSNDRTYLNATEHTIIFDNVAGDVVDMRLSCQFNMQIVPQMSSRNGRIWNLNHKYFIFGATGSAQPDELNAHDTSQGSHYYPIVSARAINPALIGARLYELPAPFVEPTAAAAAASATTEQPAIEATTAVAAEHTSGSVMTVISPVALLVAAILLRTL